MLRGVAGSVLVVGIGVGGWGVLPGAYAAPAASESATGTGGLDPMLATAYTLAEREAHEQGVPLWVTSGYRTHEQQQELWEDGLVTYGGPDAARRWVLPPEESTHVQGKAVDVGPEEGARWLEANGSRWGLCRTFDNEYWHFELATAPGGECPPRIADASVR
ncbi:M15 family metallopeptidase [Nocardia mexicana]|uniref:D-alanyl-D-alanine carboxypeptidase-like protein n=1 Tax=Nocardia mexicana TaxID=279262 RepID=A0A370H4I6_9NOCA|nr:M15 family metallopeptidase [Nocardia mexicana]RDI50834.1 D-alanyl-D-alanine carboxypeptidase-like protein [Nocardia mexicana]